MRAITTQSDVQVLAGVYRANISEDVVLQVAESNFEPGKLERGGAL